MVSRSHPTAFVDDIEAGAIRLVDAGLSPLPIAFSRKRQALVTRLLDVVLSFLALLVLAPLLLLLGLAIRLDSRGPVLFRQTRTGLKGQTFRIYKFRTMRVLEDGPEIQQATRSDARITPVGRILRQTSLDELPQLLNVIRGEMSLVGPRPHAVAHDEFYGRAIAAYHLRFHVKPGITGWAQIHGARGQTPTLEHMRRRVELDLWYGQNASIVTYLVILLRTPTVAFQQRKSVC